MKKTILFFTVVCLAFASCSNDNDDNTNYSTSEAQRKTLSVLNGTFKNTHEVGVTTIVFKEQYQPAKEITLEENYVTEENRKRYIHGLYTVTYYDGSSFDKYYHISVDGSLIGTSFTEKGTRSFSKLIINSPTEFKMQGKNDLTWKVFKKD